jgi:putative peptidoglycan lipid II flippase
MLILVQRRPWRDGIATPVRISFDPQIRGFLRKGIPGMVANAGPQFLIVGGAIIASSSPAAVSWLYFANRLIELPLGMVGVAMGTVLVPELTRAIRSDDRDALMQAESRGRTCDRAGLAGGAWPDPAQPTDHPRAVRARRLHSGRYHRYSTGALDSRARPARARSGQGAVPGIFAREDTRTPLVATMSGVIVAVICGLLLGRSYGASGVAASISLGAWFCAAILTWRGSTTFGFSIDATARRRLPRIAICAAAMGAMLSSPSPSWRR